MQFFEQLPIRFYILLVGPCHHRHIICKGMTIMHLLKSFLWLNWVISVVLDQLCVASFEKMSLFSGTTTCIMISWNICRMHPFIFCSNQQVPYLHLHPSFRHSGTLLLSTFKFFFHGLSSCFQRWHTACSEYENECNCVEGFACGLTLFLWTARMF